MGTIHTLNKSDAFGLYPHVGSHAQFHERVEKIRNMLPTELKGMSRRQIAEKIGVRTATTITSLPVDEIMVAAGKKHVLGTIYGDALKEIARGRVRNLVEDNRPLAGRIIRILEAAGIADRKTGYVDLDAVKKCLRENRIVWKE